MPDLGKLLMFFGLILVVGGLVLMLFGRMNIPLGRLPGDIVYRGKQEVARSTGDTSKASIAATLRKALPQGS